MYVNALEVSLVVGVVVVVVVVVGVVVVVVVGASSSGGVSVMPDTRPLTGSSRSKMGGPTLDINCLQAGNVFMGYGAKPESKSSRFTPV